MAKALKCDRCGNFFDLLNEARKYQISFLELSDDLSGTYPKYVDLCPDCYAKFLLFLRFVDGSTHYEFKDCDNIKGERVIKCREESDGSSST